MRIRFLILILSVVSVRTAFAQNLSFDVHQIDLNFAGMHCIRLFDMDGDGDLDIVGGSEITPNSQSMGLAWWRNDGGDPIQWTRFAVDPYFVHVMSVDVAYVDDDPYPDIIATSWNLHQIAWWKHSGDATTGWVKRIVRSNFTNAHDAKGADINQDGHTDIVGLSSTSAELIVFLNNGSSSPGWNRQTLSSAFRGGKVVDILDLDHDGDLDIVGTASDVGTIAWWEHGGGSPISWTYHRIASNYPGAGYLDVVDLNDDGLYDVIASSWQMNEMSYWLCEDLMDDQWQKTQLTTQLPTAGAVAGHDLDQDGDQDIVTVGKYPGEVRIYENVDFFWNRHNLRYNFDGGAALAVEDLDEDGDLDIIAGASGLGDLYWWENQLTTGIPNDQSQRPAQFHLHQNYPNPFNPTTTIQYAIPQPGRVRLEIFDASGRWVSSLVDAHQEPGVHSVEWHGLDMQGHPVGSGIYLCRLVQSGRIEIQKLILSR